MTTSRKKAALLILAVSLTAIAATSGVRYYLDNVRLPRTPPRQVVEEYFTALGLEEYKKAYAFVSAEYYHESFNQFVDRAAMYSPAMRLEVKGESIEEDRAMVAVRVTVPMAFGLYEAESSMDLVRAGREWKIVHP